MTTRLAGDWPANKLALALAGCETTDANLKSEILPAEIRRKGDFDANYANFH